MTDTATARQPDSALNAAVSAAMTGAYGVLVVAPELTS